MHGRQTMQSAGPSLGQEFDLLALNRLSDGASLDLLQTMNVETSLKLSTGVVLSMHVNCHIATIGSQNLTKPHANDWS